MRTMLGERQFARGCMNKPCPDETANAEFCAEREGVRVGRFAH